MDDHQTAPTHHIEVGSTNFAFRRFGKEAGKPIVLLQHFTGGLDHWDPLLTNGLAEGREVILVDVPGIGGSTGETPRTIEGMAAAILEFVDAICLDKFDLLGFSIGGMVAQAFAKTNAQRLNRLILCGTSPRGGELSPYIAEVRQRATGNANQDDFLWLFFGHSETGKAAGRAFWERRMERAEDRDPPTAPMGIMAQQLAGRDWLEPHGERFADLAAITVPTLIVNGTRDVMLPTINSFHLQQYIPDAQLVIYPDAGHASQFQHPDLFLKHARIFLDD